MSAPVMSAPVTSASVTSASGTGGADGERVIARLRPHGRALFWPSVALIATAGALGYFVGRFPEDWQNHAVLAGGALAIVVLWLLPLLGWLAKRYVLTTRRVIIRRGLIVRSRQELPHGRGYDITVRRNLLQSIVRSGDVLINAGLDRPIVLRDCPSPDLVQRSLHDLMERNANPIAARLQQQQSSPADETTVWGVR